MNSPRTNTDHILIAEYTLGLLDAHELARAHSLLGQDDDAVATALGWEQSLLELTDLLPPVDPSPLLLQRIQSALGHNAPPAPSNLYRQPDRPATPATNGAANALQAAASHMNGTPAPPAPLDQGARVIPIGPRPATGEQAQASSPAAASHPGAAPSTSTARPAPASQAQRETNPDTTASHTERDTASPAHTGQDAASAAAAAQAGHGGHEPAARRRAPHEPFIGEARSPDEPAQFDARHRQLRDEPAQSDAVQGLKQGEPARDAGPGPNSSEPAQPRAAGRDLNGGMPEPSKARREGNRPAHSTADPASTAFQHASASHTMGGAPASTPDTDPVQNAIIAPTTLTPSGQRRLTRGIWIWRGATVVFAALALALALIPQGPRPTPVTVIEVAPTRAAILQAPGQSSTPGWIVTFDPQNNVLMSPQVHSDVPADAAVQLWTYNEQIRQPRSMGLVDPNKPISVPASLMGQVGEQQYFEMTLEPQGGSRTASPSGPILFIGQVVTFGSPVPASTDGAAGQAPPAAGGAAK